MSEPQELDTPRVENEEDVITKPISSEIKEEKPTKPSNLEISETPKTESSEMETTDESSVVPNETSSSTVLDVAKNRENVGTFVPQSPTVKTVEVKKPGECNLLPVLVERLRSVLEQSCSNRSPDEGTDRPSEASGVDWEDELRSWATGLCNPVENQRNDEETQNPRGLKLDLKFLEDLLLSDIQTALSRLQETLKRVDIGTLTRHSSTLDPTNKLNLLKLISSLLANLKIPAETEKPEKTSTKKTTTSRRRRSERHTIGVTSDELARARKWLEEKNLSPNVDGDRRKISTTTETENVERISNSSSTTMENNSECKETANERLDGEKQFDKVREKYMKDAINQQQSLQNKNKECNRDDKTYWDKSSTKMGESIYDDDEIINEEFGISSSSVYRQTNGQSRCNKFLAKKSKIKRANTIDIPNYLKLQAENLANNQGGCVSLRRPINIGDKYRSSITDNVIPSFEPKTENDRKFLALINKNNETAVSNQPGLNSSPYKSFNYRQTSTDKNWNSRFSNIKTTFDKPHDENSSSRNLNVVGKKFNASENSSIVGSSRFSCDVDRQKPGFIHAASSPFRKIEKIRADENSSNFVKSGYLPQTGSLLQAKVKMFDQENSATTTTSNGVKLKPRNVDSRRGSDLFVGPDSSGPLRTNDNAHRLNYHSFCKQFVPFASKNPTERKTNPWSNGHIASENSPKTREIFEERGKPKKKFPDDDRTPTKIPIARRTFDGREKLENPDKFHRQKFYDVRDDDEKIDVVQTISRSNVVAYPFEINYPKRTIFEKKNNNREKSSEKGNYEDPEDIGDDRLSNDSSLNYGKSVSTFSKNPSPLPRTNFSVNNVAVQTNRTEPSRPIYPNENFIFFGDDENSRRNVSPIPPTPPPLPISLAMNNADVSSPRRTNLPNKSRRSSGQSYENNSFDLCHPSQTFFPPSFVTPTTDCASEIRPQLPQLPQTTFQRPNYPSNADPKTDYYVATDRSDPIYTRNSFDQSAPRIPVRSNPPQKHLLSQTTSKPSIPEITDHRELREKLFRENFGDLNKMSNEKSTNFSHDFSNKNPIYVPPNRLVDNFNDVTKNSEPFFYGSDVSNNDDERIFDDQESVAVSDDRSFADDENIQNQDISSDGIVTRYACAIATVSSASDSPAISPLPITPRDSRDSRVSKIFDDVASDEIRRHNLLQQNLMQQIRRSDRPIVEKPDRRFFNENSYVDETLSLEKFPNDRAGEIVIESNNTKDKINMFEGRNDNSFAERRFDVKSLIVPRQRKETFFTPKINVVGPSKMFKPPSNVNENRGCGKKSSKGIEGTKINSIDSSDEYLMSCANKSSRSIVLSKSESWHQLAMSKTALQVPQTQRGSFARQSAPKSPSSLKLSKQYEASSSSDSVRKMEEKVQRYFRDPSIVGSPDSSSDARRDPKNKRTFVATKSQGNLVRSHTMPHIYDETNDVEKAFDSLFKEATRADNRY